MHAHNGEATLPFPALPQNIEMQYKYRYEEEGAKLDDDLKHLFATQHTPTFTKANHVVKCSSSSVKKFKTGKDMAASTDSKQAPSTGLLAQPSRPQTADRQPMADDRATSLIATVNKVRDAINSRNYQAVKDCFTPEGYSLFLTMMGAVNENGNRKRGKVIVTDPNAPVVVEQSGNFLVAKDIPIQLQYASGHKTNERIILRFSDDNRIQSVAFALSTRAEEDIFRDNRWGLDVRYAIKQFMEDYQTAFALKRLDFIMSLFTDDAIIITGKRAKGNSAPKTYDGSIQDVASGYTFSRYNKSEYRQSLVNDFKAKRYIELKFDDNEISSVGGLFNNIYWIQLKQFYNSSGYSDIGYLALMLDMRAENPQIKVRTWLPDKFDLDYLKKSFPVDDDF